MVERQDPDNFTRFQTRERCALEIAAYVFNVSLETKSYKVEFKNDKCTKENMNRQGRIVEVSSDHK